MSRSTPIPTQSQHNNTWNIVIDGLHVHTALIVLWCCCLYLTWTVVRSKLSFLDPRKLGNPKFVIQSETTDWSVLDLSRTAAQQVHQIQLMLTRECMVRYSINSLIDWKPSQQPVIIHCLYNQYNIYSSLSSTAPSLPSTHTHTLPSNGTNWIYWSIN